MITRPAAFAVLSSLLFVAGFGQRPLSAQIEDDGRVNGAGSASVQRLPESMRMQVAILGKGATLKDAMASLKTRVDAAKTQLGALGADKASISVDAAKIYEQQNDRQRQMEMMMAQRLRAGGKKDTKKKVAPPIMVAATLTASWNLKAKDAEELLLAAHPLQEKIKSADLAGAKDAEKLSPEQEELMEEAEAGGYSPYDNGNEAKPGEPSFLFVSRVSEEDREQALADAFKKATAEAALLAKTAGGALGKLKSIQNNSYGGVDSDDYGMNYNYNSSAYRMMQMARSQQSRQDDKLEAIGIEPGMVKYVVNVNVSFEIAAEK